MYSGTHVGTRSPVQPRQLNTQGASHHHNHSNHTVQLGQGWQHSNHETDSNQQDLADVYVSHPVANAQLEPRPENKPETVATSVPQMSDRNQPHHVAALSPSKGNKQPGK